MDHNGTRPVLCSYLFFPILRFKNPHTIGAPAISILRAILFFPAPNKNFFAILNIIGDISHPFLFYLLYPFLRCQTSSIISPLIFDPDFGYIFLFIYIFCKPARATPGSKECKTCSICAYFSRTNFFVCINSPALN